MRCTHESMAVKDVCPICGAALEPELAGGQCPKCLLRLAWPETVIEGASQSEPGTPAFIPGTLTATEAENLFGDYCLEAEIARGGMGVVYRARQISLSRSVALKMIATGQFANPALVQRFQIEAGAAARLDHPHIVPIYEMGEYRGQVYYSMKLVEGGNLAQLNAECRSRDAEWHRWAAGVLINIADAVHYGHQRGVLHRDLKPANILMETKDCPRVTDFGLAKVLKDESGLTLSTAVLGTPAYMGPEQAAGHVREISTATDIYSLGAILYELLTGRPPFEGKNALAIMRQVLEQEPVRPRALNPSVPPDLETICLKCLEKRPAARYATAQDLSADLTRFLLDEPIQARRVTHAERTWRWCRRKPLVAGLLTSLVLACGLGLSGVLWEWRRALTGELTARQHQYVADMNLVKQVWDEGDTRRARARLLAYVPKPGEQDLRGFEWRYLWALCGQDDSRSAYTNFSNSIRDLALSPDGRYLAAAAGRAIKLLDPASQRELLEMADADASDSVQHLAWVPTCSNLLATAGSGGSMKFWNLETKQITLFASLSSEGQPAELGDVAFSPDGNLLAVAALRGNTLLSVWDVKRRTALWTTNLALPPCALAFTKNGRELVTGGGESGNVRVWDVTTGKELDPFPALHTGWLWHIAFSPDGLTLATCGYDNRIILWDYSQRRQIIPPLDSPSQSVAFSPDGSLVAAGGVDGAIRIWNVRSGAALTMLRGHGGPVCAITFTPDGTTIVSGSADRTVRVWDSTPPRDRDFLFHERLCINSIGFSPDSKCLATGSFHRTWTEVWDLTSRQWITNLAGHWYPAMSAVFSPDSRYLATGSYDNLITLWDPNTFERRAVLTNDFGVGSLAFSADSQLLAAAMLSINPPDGSRTLAFWDMGSLRKLDRLAQAAPNAGVVAFSHRGRVVAVGYVDGWVRLWDFESERKLAEFRGSGRTTCPLAFSPDDRLLACNIGSQVLLYDAVKQRELRQLEGHTLGLLALAFAPNGRTLASAGEEGTIKLWNLATGEIALTLKAPGGRAEPVYSLAFSRDGNLLAGGGLDGDVRLWPATPFHSTTQTKPTPSKRH